MQIIFIVVAIAAPFLAWGLTEADYRWRVVPKAVAAAEISATAAEHQRGIDACDARVEGIRKQIAAASEEAQKLALEAEESLQGTPEEKAARRAMCDADVMCRARKGN